MTRLQLALAALIVVLLPIMDGGPTARGQLDPNAFPSLGTLNVSSGTLTIDTDALTASSPVSFLTGVAINQNGGPQAAVFDFSSLTIGSGVTVTLQGSRPLALLSRGNATIQTSLTTTNQGFQVLGSYLGGQVTTSSTNTGGGQAGFGPGGGGANNGYGAAGGGGYGGKGGPAVGGLGGLPYGNLYQTLQGGSGGGAGAYSTGDFASADGGNGGGALEVVAVGTLAVAGVFATGGNASAAFSGSNFSYLGGGGAGGGILLSGQAGLTLNGPLSALGGGALTGGQGTNSASGGGGGRIALTGLSSYTLGTIPSLSIDLLGGGGSGSGGSGFAGVLTVDALSTTIPSGTSVTLNGGPFISVAGSTTSTGPTVEAYARHDVVVNGTAALTATNACQNVTINANASATLGATNACQNLTVNANGTATLQATNAFQTLGTLNGTLNLNGFSLTVDAFTEPSGGTGLVNLPAGSTLTVGVNGANGFFYGGQLSGPGSFVKAGAGTQHVTAASPNFTGQTIVTGGALGVGDQALQNSTVVLAGGGIGFDFGQNPVLGALAGAANIFLGGITFNSLTVGGNGASTTFSGNLSGSVPAGLIKAGTGTWTLTGSNTQTGPFDIQAGTVLIGSPGALAPSNPVSVSAGATLDLNGYGYSVTSGNSLTVQGNLRFGGAGVTIASGTTANYNVAFVSNGFLGGSGTQTITGGTALSGVTTSPSAVINQTGPGSFLNFTNGGSLTVAAGAATPSTFGTFTNQGSGSITVAASSQVDAADFQTYGTLTLSPGSTAMPTQMTNAGGSPLYFNGGSRTFISIPSHANPNEFDAGIDLHGQNAVVAGGLFVNNGYVVDSTNTSPPVTVIADFGSLVKGAGFFQNSVQTINGGKFQSGNSPGQASFGSFTFGAGGISNYLFAIDDAAGTAGPSPDANGQVSGWGLVKTVQRPVGETTTSGDFAWTATAANKLTVSLDTLVNPTTVGTNVAGPMADFDPTKPYSWLAASWAGSYSGPPNPAGLSESTVFDTSGFENPIEGTFGWNLDAGGHSLSLTYTPSAVPEPGTLVLTGLAGFGLAIKRRRR